MKLVYLPGLDGTGLLFEPLRRALSPATQPVVFDYSTQRLATYDELATQIRPRLPANEPFVLLGESFGGPLAMKLAAERPPGLSGLILSASFITCPHHYVPQWAAKLVFPAMFYPAPMLAKFRALIGNYSTPELQSLLERSMSQVAPSVLAGRLQEIIKIDVTHELQMCPAPILYLQGTQDYVVPASNLKQIQQVRPDVKSIQIDAPHMILQTQPAVAAGAIEQFVSELS